MISSRSGGHHCRTHTTVCGLALVLCLCSGGLVECAEPTIPADPLLAQFAREATACFGDGSRAQSPPACVQCLDVVATGRLTRDDRADVPHEVAQAFTAWLGAAVSPDVIPGNAWSEFAGYRDALVLGGDEKSDVVVASAAHSGSCMVALQTLDHLCLVLTPSTAESRQAIQHPWHWLALLQRSLWPQVDSGGAPLLWAPHETYVPEGDNRSKLIVVRPAASALRVASWSLGPVHPFSSGNHVIWDEQGHVAIALRKNYGPSSTALPMHSGSILQRPLSQYATRKPTASPTHVPPPESWNLAPVHIEFYADPLQFDEGHYSGEPFLVCGRLPRGLERLPTGEQTDEARVAALAQCRARMPEHFCPDGVIKLMHFYRAGDAGAGGDVHFRAKYLIEDRRLLVWGVVGRETAVYVEPVVVESADDFAEHLAALFKIDEDVSAATRGGDFIAAGEWGRASTVTGYRRWYDFALGRDTVEPITGLVVRFFDRGWKR